MEAKASFACLRLQLVGKGGSQGSEHRIVRKGGRGNAGSLTIDASSVSSFSQSSQTHESVEVGSIIAPQVPMMCIEKKIQTAEGGIRTCVDTELTLLASQNLARKPGFQTSKTAILSSNGNSWRWR